VRQILLRHTLLSVWESNLAISNSEAATFNECEQKWKYAFVDKLAKRRKSQALNRGIVGHELMAVFFSSLKNTHDWDYAMESLFDASIKLSSDSDPDRASTASYLVNTIVSSLNYYKQRILSWEIISVEEAYRVNLGDLGDGITYNFKVDLLVRENGGLIKVIDFKFVYDFYSDEQVDLLPQLPLYVGGLRASGIPVARAYYMFIRYRNVKELGEGNRFLLRHVNPSHSRIIRAFKDIIQTSEVIEFRRDRVPRRMPSTQGCKMCSFKQLCVAELNDVDTSIMRAEDYVTSDYGYGEE